MLIVKQTAGRDWEAAEALIGAVLLLLLQVEGWRGRRRWSGGWRSRLGQPSHAGPVPWCRWVFDVHGLATLPPQLVLVLTVLNV